MLDVAVSYNRYKFLGHEFLTWLWFTIDRRPETIRAVDPELASLEIGKRMVLEKRKNKVKESLTIKGEPVSLAEGVLALQKGSLVSELHIVYRTEEDEWQFSIKGESLNISGCKTPPTGPVEKKEDLVGAVLEKVYLVERAIDLIEALYRRFIGLRVSDQWDRDVVPDMRRWIIS